jgi:hypothetical protein
MRICVTYWNGETNRCRFFKTIKEARNFILTCRKMRPEYADFKMKTIKY